MQQEVDDKGDQFGSYLHVCVVGRGEGLVHRCRAAPLTAVGVVAFGVDDPLAPAELIKVHPHVHLPAEGTLLLLLRVPGGRGGSSHPLPPLLGAVVPLDPVTTHPGAGNCIACPLPVQADILGVLRCADERRRPLAAWVLSGEDHHHDPVCSRVVHHLLLLLRLSLALQLPQ